MPAVGALSARGRLFVVLAFVLSAALCATAAIALVVASNNKKDKTDAIPTFNPTVVVPTDSPTPEPSATPTPTLTATATPTASATPAASQAATASASPAASATRSPSPRATHASPKPSATPVPNPDGLFVDATLDPAGGDTSTDDLYKLYAHATDNDGTIKLVSVKWGDGTTSTTATSTTECAASAPGDCKNFYVTHYYKTAGTFDVTLTISSGPHAETSVIHLTCKVKTVAPKPTPSPTAS